MLRQSRPKQNQEESQYPHFREQLGRNGSRAAFAIGAGQATGFLRFNIFPNGVSATFPIMSRSCRVESPGDFGNHWN
jgi:hypothetical protein